jgi:hypothetical protein
MYEIRQPEDCEPQGSAQVTENYFGDLAATGDIRLTANSHRWKLSAAAFALQLLLWWARNDRASVRGGNLRNGGCDVCAH